MVLQALATIGPAAKGREKSMNAVEESTLFEASNIKVTDGSVVIDSKPYPLSNITSAEKIKRWDRSIFAAAFVFLVGAVMLVHPIKYILMTPNDPIFWLETLPGVAFCVFGMWVFLKAKPVFSVRMKTASGESVTVKSHTENMADHTVKAIAAAIALARTNTGN